MPYSAMRPDGGGPIPSSAIVPPDPQQLMTGQHKLKVEPSAIVETKKVFLDAINKLEPELNAAANDLRLAPWAGDPVSKTTAEKFNQRTFHEGKAAAYEALKGYHDQLKGAYDALDQMEQQYRQTEGDNAALWGKRV